MEILTEINKKQNIRRHIVKGAIDLLYAIERMNELYNSPTFDPEMNFFWDLRKADLSDLSFENIRLFSDFVAKQWSTFGKIRVSIVVSRDLDFGLSRMFQMMTENSTTSEIGVF